MFYCINSRMKGKVDKSFPEASQDQQTCLHLICLRTEWRVPTTIRQILRPGSVPAPCHAGSVMADSSVKKTMPKFCLCFIIVSLIQVSKLMKVRVQCFSSVKIKI